MSRSETGPSNIDPRIVRAWHHAIHPMRADVPHELLAWINAHYGNVSGPIDGREPIGVVPMSDEMIRQFEDLTGIYHLPADVVRQRLEGES